jgi:hypothetical protein
MFDSIKRQPRRRVVKVGIAAAAAAAAVGAVFVAQAGAATKTPTAKIVLMTAPGAKCAYISVYSPNGKLKAHKTLAYDGTLIGNGDKWSKGKLRPNAWNSTRIKAPVGYSVYVDVDYKSSKCSTAPDLRKRLWITPPDLGFLLVLACSKFVEDLLFG